MKRIGDEVVALVEDYAAAIDALGDRAAENTVAAARKSLDGLLGKLRRSYNTFLDEAVPDRPSGRRPLEYTIAETTARYRDLTAIAADFLPEPEIKALERQYRKDLAEAIGKGGQLQAELVKLIDPRRATPFAGPDPAVVKAAAERTSAFIRGEAMTFRDGLTKIALDGVAKGSGYKTILKDVKTLLRGAADPGGITRSMGLERRAELIARTEISNAYVEAQRRYAQAGGYRYVRWIAVGDERTCLTCGSRSGRVFRVDEITAPAHPRCVLPQTLVSPGLTAAAFRSMYRGDVVAIALADGQELTVTSNHPMLTARGIVKASSLRDGDKLIKELGSMTDSLGLACPDFDQAPATAEDVFTALRCARGVSAYSVPATAMDLHGDGAKLEADVDVVRAQGLLQYRHAPGFIQGLKETQHVGTGPEFHPFSGVGDLDALRLAMNAASRGLVGWRDHGLALLGGGLLPAEQHRLAAAAWRDPQLAETPSDYGPADPELLGHALDALASHVALTDVVQIKIVSYHGPVYTFETMAGVYPVGVGIQTGNCRCSLSAVPNEAVEEQDPELRRTLLDEEFWEQQREEGRKVLAEANGWDLGQVEAKIRANLQKPTSSERRLYPDLKRSAQAVD